MANQLLKVAAWNMRDLNYIDLDIMCLQETHLEEQRLERLHRIGYSYHSTFSHMANGDSILINQCPLSL